MGPSLAIPPVPPAGRRSPWSSCHRSCRTARSSCAARPAPAWTGTCPRSGPSPSPPWCLRRGSAGLASETASGGQGSRPACCGWSYWPCCRGRGQRDGVGREEERQALSDGRPRQVPRSWLREQGLGLGRKGQGASLHSLRRNTAAGQKRAVVST